MNILNKNKKQNNNGSRSEPMSNVNCQMSHVRNVTCQMSNVSKGFSLLLMLIVLGSVSLAFSMMFSDSSLALNLSARNLANTNQAKALANACAETALMQIRNSTNFSGTGNLTLDNQSCSYTVTNLGGENRQTESVSTVGKSTRRVKVLINTINPKIIISSWED